MKTAEPIKLKRFAETHTTQVKAYGHFFVFFRSCVDLSIVTGH